MFRMNYRTAVILAAVITLCCCAFSGPAAAEEAFVENEWNYVDRSMDVSRGIPENATGVLERIRRTEEARHCYRLARQGKMGGFAGTALAMSYRRSGEKEAAAGVWREMIRERRGGITPYVELAKYEEHFRRDYAAALDLTERALALASEPVLREDGTVQEHKNELQYRRQRLLRKLKERL